MTERKPPGISFTSWVDQQVNDAMERGAFDNLPGAGKPIPNRGEPDDGQAWLRDYVRRETGSVDEMLPTPLKLRKQIEQLSETMAAMRSEREVQEAVAALNQRIMEWRRIPLGPPVFVPLVNEEAVLDKWREKRRTLPSPSSPAATSQITPTEEGRAHRWWHRLIPPRHH